jgi:DNA-binding winged helix-turn-helix (wHTH) protein
MKTANETPMTSSSERVLEFGQFRLLTGPRLLLKAGQPVRLGSRAREILIYLVEHAGRLVRKTELVKHVWSDTIVGEGTLRVHIAKLRKALEDGQRGTRYIENVTGQGYRFVAPLTPLGNSDSSGWARPEPAASPQHRCD